MCAIVCSFVCLLLVVFCVSSINFDDRHRLEKSIDETTKTNGTRKMKTYSQSALLCWNSFANQLTFHEMKMYILEIYYLHLHR